MLSYSLDKVLAAIDPSVHPPGVFDELLLPVLGVIEDESFGSAGEAKDATEYGSGIREVKKRPGPGLYSQVAAGVSQGRLQDLLGVVK